MSSAEIRRVEEILTSEYSTEKYVELLKEIFDDIQLVAPDKHRKEYSNYSSHIEGYCHIGFYNAPENKKVILYAVRLKSLGYVEHSRSTQRSYVKALIENSGSDAAIVAFYSERDAKWRLSFVRLDYEAQMQNGKVKLAQNMTPAKRYSFLVGKDEPCHTAIERFHSFLEGNTANPSLDDLEEAFSVEAVTKEFFNLYCEKFKQLLIHLEDSEEFMAEATAHNFTAAQFAKKLMGQIVFLYFLQKKGWLGVNAWPKRISEKEYKDAYYRFGKKTKELIPVVYLPAGDGTYVISGAGLNRISDEDEAILARSVKGEPWGTGPRNFMRKLFETAAKKNLNFFDNYLEPLFYNALNRNRGEQGYDPNLHCRIPFLSGGLFEPLAGYDWEHSEFSIPNEVFSNRQNNNSRTGDGILDVFDRYNFTMSEDEPLEREVAIDPEMLGKVFENLLEVRDRKAKGAFYTPREIVHYMCQESLIAYLKESLQTDEASVRDFILYGDFMKDSDTVNKRNIQQSNLMISEQLFKVDGNGNVVVNRLMEMDEALREIRVADPAVGSGAFPLGMLNEIVRARQNISAYMAIGKNPNQIRMMYALERAPYALKRDTIRNCIFAADIDPSAVDIARLRLWLSLVIDDEINPTATDELDGHRNPLPLPNLECNIICGNSLIDEFEGIKLINQSELIGTAAEGQTNLGIGVFEPILKKLIATQEELFKCDNTDTKKQLLEQIDSLKDRIIRSQLEGAAPEIIEHYEDSKMAPSKPYLLWQLEFAKVFKEKGGFDVVIGNPPYGAKIGAKDKAYFKKNYLCAKTVKGKQKGSTDTFAVFIEAGYNLCKKDGVLNYIVPMSVISSDSMTALHNLLESNCETIKVSSYSNRPKQIFDAACVRTSIIGFRKTYTSVRTCFTTRVIRRSKDNSIAEIIKNLEFVDSQGHKLEGRYPKLGSDMELNIIRKMRSFGRTISDYAEENSDSAFYYRTAGGRYFNVIMDYPTGSTAEKAYCVRVGLEKILAMILSSNLFWFYQQVYTDGLNIKRYEIDTFPVFIIENVQREKNNEIHQLYALYVEDVESHTSTFVASEASSYNVSRVKTYKLSKSKHIIDKIDDLIGPLYGLTKEEIEFIKNYELAVRMGD